MHYKAAFLLALSLTVAGAANSFAQSRTLGAQSIVLDDGAGHTVTLVVANPAGGTFTFPAGGGTVATTAFLTGNYLALAGGTMTGAIAMGGNNITNVGQMAIASATPIEDLTVGSGFGLNQTPVMVAGSATDPTALFLGYSHPTVTANARYDGGGWKYNGAGPATSLDLVGGALAVDNAPTGAAGGGITWTSRMNLDASGNLSLPTGGLSVGSTFNLNSTGNITKLNNVTTSFPATQGAVGSVLTNDGSGGLSWVGASGFTPAYMNAYLPGLFPTAIPTGTQVIFPILGSISGFTPSGAGFTVATSGTYLVEYSVSPTTVASFSLSVNGFDRLISQVDCAANSTTHGNAVLALNAGDVLSLVNAGFSAVVLGTSNPSSAEASLSAVRIQ